VYVPDSYTPDQKFGLFVWVSPEGRGGMPRDWLETINEKKLIWIGPDNIGNQRHIDHRCRLVVEAVLQMREAYNIDPDRVYVGGFSGGGKIAAMTAVNYTELFTGAFSICGPIFYKQIPTGRKKGEFYPQGYYPPPPAALKLAKSRLRHVLLSGSEDFNLQPTDRIFELGYTKEGFKNILKIIVPGLDHSLPSAEFFAQGIDFLDE
jgi:predicted esterase